MPDRECQAFVRGYVACMSWSGTVLTDDENASEYPTPDRLDAEFHASVWDTVRADCLAFIDEYHALLEVAEGMGTSWESLGHDLWLTRNRHGAGYWDRGLGEIGRLLTDAAHGVGECDYFALGEDGFIYAL